MIEIDANPTAQNRQQESSVLRRETASSPSSKMANSIRRVAIISAASTVQMTIGNRLSRDSPELSLDGGIDHILL